MIRKAKKEEAKILTMLSFESKNYWNYPKAYFEIWKRELTIQPEYIEKNEVCVVGNNSEIAGYYSVVEFSEDLQLYGETLWKGFWLEHMFVFPRSIGQGLGTEMFKHLHDWCRVGGMQSLNILADPNATGFYQKMGCEYQRDFASSIKNRSIPYFVLQVGKQFLRK